MVYEQFTTQPAREKDTDLIEQALKKHDIDYCVEQKFGRPTKFITYSTPEHMLRQEGFLVWGSRTELVCRLRHVLRRK